MIVEEAELIELAGELVERDKVSLAPLGWLEPVIAVLVP